MSTAYEREAIASRLIEHIKNEDVDKIESCMKQFAGDSQWRDIVRFEFSIPSLLDDMLRYDVVLPRLMCYEIKTLSPVHYAAYKGNQDIIIDFLDNDVPVDVTLSSGTTVLHMASFGGHASPVKTLIDVYKADINKQDRYGWSALHYACTEGHLQAVQVLVECKIDLSLRDQDGTTAAFRAQVNGYEDIVDFLCTIEDEDDLLNIETEESSQPQSVEEDPYSVIAPLHERQLPKPISTTPEYQNSSILRDKKSSTLAQPTRRANSMIVTAKESQARKSRTLPRSFLADSHRTSTIRRVIQEEMKRAMEDEDSGYMRPADISDGREEVDFSGIGPNTLKGIMRQEMSKFAKEHFSRSKSQDIPDAVISKSPPGDSPDYEDIMEVRKAMQNLPPPSTEDIPQMAPPLPPRNPDMPQALNMITGSDGDSDEDSPRTVMLKRGSYHQVESAALQESIKKIAPLLGNDWIKVAQVLPIEPNPEKNKRRIAAIEAGHPGDPAKQAAMALAVWRVNRGPEAEVDDLIIALRKCNMHSLIEDVERVSQEFTA